MLAPRIVDLLAGAWLLLLVAWATDAFRASMHDVPGDVNPESGKKGDGPPARGADAPHGEERSMLRRSGLLSVVITAVCTTVALADEGALRPNEVPGWGRVIDPSQDCDIALDRENERLTIRVPGTPHVLSAEVPQLPMSAPLVVRRVRGDFTADVHVLGRLEPGRSSTTLYDPYHGAGLIVWQDRSNYLRLERAVGFIKGRHRPYINYEVREGGRLVVSRGVTIADRSLFLKLRREGVAFSACYSHDGRRWVELGRVDATFAERVEVGVVAVNSSKRTLSAELEGLSIEDPQGSMARDDADPDSDEPSSISPPSNGGTPIRP
jgi:regulation of enolase protein 1 (concanavalin A-like superfamily)